MGGVGLSEFEDIIKHTFPHIFVRMVAEVIRPRSMQINLRPPEDNRQLIIWGELKSPWKNEINLPGAAKSLAFILSISSAIPTVSILLTPKL